MVEKAERKERKRQQREKQKLAKLAKKIRLLDKKAEAERKKKQKNCPYTGKRAWKNSLEVLKARNTYWGNPSGGGGEKTRRVVRKAPPLCDVCGRSHW